MNEAKQFLIDYMNNHPDNLDEDTGQPYFTSLYEMLSEIYDVLSSETTHISRWWDNMFVVQEINGRLIGFDWAQATGDDTAWEKGWEFNENSICFVEPYEVTITKYRKI